MAIKFSFGWSKQIEPVLQEESADCGLACIAMLLTANGAETSIADLKRCVQSSARGSNLASLTKLAGDFGLQLRSMKIDMTDFPALKLPAILHFDGNHFVLLKRVWRGVYFINDPALGARKISSAEMSSRFTGVAVESYLSDRFNPTPSTKDSTAGFLRRLGRLKGFKSSITAILILASLIEVTVLAGPLLMQVVVDSVTVSHDVRLLTVMCVGYLFLTVFQAIASSFRSWAIAVLGASLNVGWLTNIFRRLLVQPERFFHGRTIGDLSSRFSGLDHVQSAVSIEAIEVVLDGVLALGTLIMLFLYSKEMAFAAVFGVAIYLVAKIISFKVISEANLDVIAAQAKKETLFVDSVRSQSTLRLTNMQGFQVSRFSDAATNLQKSLLKLSSIQLVFSSIGVVLIGAVKVVTIYLGGRLIMDGAFTAGMLIAFLAYCDQFSGRSSKLIDYVMNWRVLKVYTDRLREVVDSPVEAALYRTMLPSPLTFELVVDNVSFRYGQNDSVILNAASMKLKEGGSVAIVGPSGSGKTTLIKLISGSIVPSYGSIRLGDMTYEQLGKMRVRDYIGFVTQDDELLVGTIEQNVCLFDNDPDFQRITDCCIIAEINETIMRMPMRYQTEVGGGSLAISSGQKQRILIARALYRMPKILVFDEATSHLDIESEAAIFRNLSKLEIGKIIVAHRPETVAHADDVFLLHDGTLLNISQDS